ncbi:MAG TPA: hypothetical protein VIM18_01805, partial [Solirubrobacteraceae bacterium]
DRPRLRTNLAYGPTSPTDRPRLRTDLAYGPTSSVASAAAAVRRPAAIPRARSGHAGRAAGRSRPPGTVVRLDNV